MHFGLVTLFPEMFDIVERSGVVGSALKDGLISLETWNPREFTEDRHRTVDDRPYGGGPGMLMKVKPLQDAIRAAKNSVIKANADSRLLTVYLSPQGERLDHQMVVELAGYDSIVCVSGRYEGVDERLIKSEIDKEISIGDYVLSGGELASMVLIDAVSRMIPEVLGHADSADEDSFVSGLLYYPHYTRPDSIGGDDVPEVLLSGNHEKIRIWRLKQSLGRTWLRRPDLLEKLSLDEEQQCLLQEFIKEINR